MTKKKRARVITEFLRWLDDEGIALCDCENGIGWTEYTEISEDEQEKLVQNFVTAEDE